MALLFIHISDYLSFTGKFSGTIDKSHLNLLRSREAGYKTLSKNLVFDYILFIERSGHAVWYRVFILKLFIKATEDFGRVRNSLVPIHLFTTSCVTRAVSSGKEPKTKRYF